MEAHLRVALKSPNTIVAVMVQGVSGWPTIGPSPTAIRPIGVVFF